MNDELDLPKQIMAALKSGCEVGFSLDKTGVVAVRVVQAKDDRRLTCVCGVYPEDHHSGLGPALAHTILRNRRQLESL